MGKSEKLRKLRRVITENLRVQQGGAEPIPYIDVSNALEDVVARQNHAIFARRGCGKTLLLHHSGRILPDGTKRVYLNCEEFKKHSFPNVLVEILDAVFAELEKHLTSWFGKQKRSKEIIGQIRRRLQELKRRPDERDENVREAVVSQTSDSVGAGLVSKVAKFEASTSDATRMELERTYKQAERKISELEWLVAATQESDS